MVLSMQLVQEYTHTEKNMAFTRLDTDGNITHVVYILSHSRMCVVDLQTYTL